MTQASRSATAMISTRSFASAPMPAVGSSTHRRRRPLANGFASVTPPTNLTGRYAYFIEDESMKANVNVTGNGLAGGSNLRVNDLTLPLPTPAPPPSCKSLIRPPFCRSSADREAADSALDWDRNRRQPASPAALALPFSTNGLPTSRIMLILSRSSLATMTRPPKAGREWISTPWSLPRPTTRRKWP